MHMADFKEWKSCVNIHQKMLTEIWGGGEIKYN